MFNGLGMNMGNLSRISNAETRSISAENFKGEKGKGGMATTGAAIHGASELGQKWKVSPYIVMEPCHTYELADIEGPGAIQHIWMTIGQNEGRLLILRIYWEDNENPSVECPVGDFFCDSRLSQTTRVQTLAVCRNPGTGMNCFWEMPFRKRCRITVENLNYNNVCLYYQIDYTLTDVPDDCAYFHAQFRRTMTVPYMSDYTIVDGIRGQGQYVGTYMTWLPKSCCISWFGEGEIKFFMDGDTEFPTICGTGTEDYFLGSYGFELNGKPSDFTSPYSGMYHFNPDDNNMTCNSRIFCMYRFHLMDPIRFKSDLRITFQDLGWHKDGRYKPLEDDMSSVAFWYQTMPFEKFPELPCRDYLEFC